MTVSEVPQTTPATPSKARRFFAHPLVWMPIGVVAISAAAALADVLGSAFGSAGEAAGTLLGGVLALVLYRLVLRRIAGRQTPELAFAWGRVARRALLGAAIGVGFIAVSVSLLVLLGVYTVTWQPVDAVGTVAAALAVSLGAAIVEELVFRGVAFRAIEELAGRRVVLGRALALGITAVLFGAAHMLNAGATLWSGVSITVEAGLMLGAAFLWKRDLWFVIGLHTAWNAAERLLGIAVSGHRDPGIFVTTAHGPELLTGGAFGLEASIVPVLVGLALAVAMLLRSRATAATR
ncbi:CPBP family intramembrane glutamic endopeptidase [Protaetiibacter intestinalis]|uniref:CPBP family intramembrane metalloprotease n=1 Tax=Protaetiibacter intestinalis TaxID=2419774 RepID=A0A387B2T7_9MICO|nr:CPBP family intramembrane glutamic endopeptidase [Protaetiibacter intestinalis]AYF97842.1 CPBP family intramembrane metalloprotease [Protaetiibacter intestinalis]